MRLWPLVLAVLVSASGCLSDLAEPRPETIERPVAYLRAEPLPALLIEIDYVEGYEPSRLALDGLRQRLSEVTLKQTLTILEPTPIPAQASTHGGRLSALEILNVSKSTFGHCGEAPAQYGTSATLHILYLDGLSEDADGTEFQGIFLSSVGCTHTIALFPEYWRTKYGVVSSPGAVLAPDSPFKDVHERQVLIHELGHALGLVGVGLPVLNERRTNDPCQCHSQNPGSVMYEGIDNATPMQQLAALQRYVQDGIEPVWAFDEDDLADIAAVRDA